MEMRLNDKSGGRAPTQDPATYQSKRAAARSSSAIAKQPAETSRKKRAKQYAYTLLVLITLLCHGCIGQPGARLGMDSVISSFLSEIDDLVEILESDSEWEVLFASMGASHCWEAIQSAQEGSYRLDVGQVSERSNKVAGVAIRYLARYKSDDVTELRISSRYAYPVNLLTELDPAIGALTSLESLYLSYNQLEYLPPEIGGLTNLNNLHLDNNQLEYLPPQIGALTRLNNLRLDNNQLKELPPEIGGLTNLRSLIIYNNQLKELPPEIGGLTSLDTLSLENNRLGYLPPEIGALTRLKRLHLENNQLEYLPPEIGALTNLRRLIIYNNQLKELPTEIGGLTNLSSLFLRDNQLKELPPEIGALTNLRTLYLYDNQLKELPPGIGGLISLDTLSLDNNQLGYLPTEIGGLINLRTLFLRNNQLKELPPEMRVLTRLQTLNLEDNQLKCMSEKLHSWWMDINTKPHQGNSWLERNGPELEVINDNADATNFVRQQAKAFMHEGHRKFARRLAQYREQYENNEKEGICHYLHHSTNNTGSWEQGKRIIFFEDAVPFYLDRQLITQEDIDAIPDRRYYHRGP